MRILSRFPLKDILIFESHPSFSCNTYPVFLELRKRLPNYKMVWLVADNSPVPDGVDFTHNLNKFNLVNTFKWHWYRSCARAFISSNRYRPMKKTRDSQLSMSLSHGCKIKKTKKHNYCPGPYVDYLNIQSHFFDDITCYEYEAGINQLVYLGFPRCDWLFAKNDISRQLSTIGVKGDFLIWLPTFRKNVNNLSRDVNSSKYNSMGIPLLYNEEMILDFNKFLKQLNLHVIFKPHPSQDVSTLKRISISNIHIISDKTLANLGIQLYQVIAESKALISDYSSVFFDYLLLNRPIAVTVDDKEEWLKDEGFAYDVDSIFQKTTEHVADLGELCDFIQNVVVDGKDEKSEARQEMCKKVIIHRDGNSAKRVADFVMEKIGAK